MQAHNPAQPVGSWPRSCQWRARKPTNSPSMRRASSAVKSEADFRTSVSGDLVALPYFLIGVRMKTASAGPRGFDVVRSLAVIS